MNVLDTNPDRPLKIAEFATEPSRLEWALAFIPVLGWIVGQCLSDRRMRPFLQRIDRVLIARKRTSIEWPSLNHEKVAAWLASQIQEEFDWSSDRFLPDDELAVLYFDDDLQSIEMLRRVEEHFDVSCEDLMERFAEDYVGVTFADLVEAINGRVSRSEVAW